jgi:hypothetical protein
MVSALRSLVRGVSYHIPTTALWLRSARLVAAVVERYTMLTMNKAFILIAVLALLSCSASAKEVSIDGGSVTFVVPDDFTELSQEEINSKYPAVNAPKQVIGAAGRTTTIAYQLKAQPVKESDLPDIQKAFTQVFDRLIPGIEWKQNALVDLVGQKWLLLEMTSRAIDQDIHNIMLITPHKGQMLMFNFNCTKKDFSKMEKVLRDSIKSIKLNP